MKVRVDRIYPPIPWRQFDYSAVDDETYDGPGCPMGFGATADEAVADLKIQIEGRNDMDYEEEMMHRKGCNDQQQDFEQEEPEEGPIDLDMRASGYIARHDPDAMDRLIAADRAKLIITNTCKSFGVAPPNSIAMGFAIEIINGLTSFNAEQMLAKSITSKGLDIRLLRKNRQEFEQAA